MTNSFYNKASYIVLSIIFIIIICTYTDYGISWDEPAQDTYGRLCYNYYKGWFTNNPDLSVFNYGNLYLYGPFFELITVIINKFSPLDRYDTRHLINAIVGFITILGVWRFAKLLKGADSSFFSIIFLSVFPRFYGDMFNNPKDIPFACGYIWSIYYILQSIDTAVPRTILFKLGIILGLTMSIRSIGLILLFYYLLITIYNFFKKGWSFIKSFIIVGLISYAIMLIFWPFAQLSPLIHPFKSLFEMSKFQWIGEVLYNGEYVFVTELPRYYLIHIFLITFPEYLIIILLSGIPIFFRALKQPNIISLKYILILFAILFPIALVFIKKPNLYDGMRHFLFIIPLLASLSGVIFTEIIQIFKKQKLYIKIFYFIISCYFIYHLSIMIRLHPYQYVYYNNFFGGLKAAVDKFELDYWGTSYREAVTMLKKYIVLRREDLKETEYKIKIPKNPFLGSYYFDSHLKETDNEKEADFFISITRFNDHNSVDGEIILTVQRMGINLAYIKDRRVIK
ncbi:MAG: glycosyltransferase family 39 protein [Candidatus Hydrogenedentota bacterium]